MLAIVGFVLAVRDAHARLDRAAVGCIGDGASPPAGSRLQFSATAYCKGTTTASGVGVRTGIAAADPTLLPVGSVVNVATGDERYNGVYTVMDTGPEVQGRILDLYMWSCHEALRVRPPRSAGHGAAARLGSESELAAPDRSTVQGTRSEAARATAGGPSPGGHAARGGYAGRRTAAR